MIVYHGSIEKVVNPEIREANRPLDYGYGFYTTTSEKQATLWVRRKLKGKGGKGYVNLYELDETCYKDLNILHFTEPTEKWVDFVMTNRTKKDFDHLTISWVALLLMIEFMRLLRCMKVVC